MRRGFTLLELLIVVIVIGILAAIAVPQFLNSVEKARIAKAKNALGLISRAEKMYHAENDAYVAASSADAANNFVAKLGKYIELEQIDADVDWQYTVTPGADAAASMTFVATAVKKDGRSYQGSQFSVTEKGVCTSDHPLADSDCPAAAAAADGGDAGGGDAGS